MQFYWLAAQKQRLDHQKALEANYSSHNEAIISQDEKYEISGVLEI